MECLVVVLGKFAAMKEWLLMVVKCGGVDRCSP